MSNETFEIREASSAVIIPVISAYGPSGGGKTLSMLLYARGLVGPKGRIVLVDSEKKRGSIFSDQVPGSYKVIDLDEPFSPDRYHDAIDHAQKNSDVTVVDSMSHEWEGPGGVLDWQEEELWRMAGDDAAKAERVKMLSWAKPKGAHKSLLRWLVNTPKPIILCFRAEFKTHFDEDKTPPRPDAAGRAAGREERQKTKVLTDKFTTPIGAKNFVWDCLVTFEMVRREKAGLEVGGFVVPRKWTHPDIINVLPRPEEQITIEHGAKLAAWCARARSAPPAGMSISNEAAKVDKPASSPAREQKSPVSERERLLGELRQVTREQHSWDGKAASWPLCKQKMVQWLVDEGILAPDQFLDTLTDEELGKAVQASKVKLGQTPKP